MVPLEASQLLDHAVLLGLITRDQARDARTEAEDRELETICRVLLRKGLLTSWQLERVKKGDGSGFFFGGCKVLFHLAEGTFARVYRGQRANRVRRSPSRFSAAVSPTIPKAFAGSTRKPRKG